MFEQTAVITNAFILIGLALSAATVHRMTPVTRKSLRRLALALVAFAAASTGAHAQSAATPGAAPTGATTPTAATAAGAATASPTLGPSRIYVTDWNAGRVRVFDPKPGPTPGTPHVGNIMVGEGPFGMAVSPDSRRLYVANSLSDTVSVIDTRWNVVHYNVGVGDYPIRIAASPDGNRIFVSNLYGNSVSVVWVGNNTTPWVERTLSIPYKPMEIAVKPGGRFLYVSQYENQNVKVFDMWNDFAEVDNIFLGQLGATQPIAFAFTADGSHLYVANEGGGPNDGGTVSFINTSNSAGNVLERTVALPYHHLPRGQMVLTPNGRHLYLPGAGEGKLEVIDTLTGDILNPSNFIGVGPHGVALSTDGSRLYVSIEGNMLSTVEPGRLSTQGQNPVLCETYVTPEVAGGTRFLSVAYVTLPSCSF